MESNVKAPHISSLVLRDVAIAACERGAEVFIRTGTNAEREVKIIEVQPGKIVLRG